jgi:hypothetical protein
MRANQMGNVEKTYGHFLGMPKTLNLSRSTLKPNELSGFAPIAIRYPITDPGGISENSQGVGDPLSHSENESKTPGKIEPVLIPRSLNRALRTFHLYMRPRLLQPHLFKYTGNITNLFLNSNRIAEVSN